MDNIFSEENLSKEGYTYFPVLTNAAYDEHYHKAIEEKYYINVFRTFIYDGTVSTRIVAVFSLDDAKFNVTLNTERLTDIKEAEAIIDRYYNTLKEQYE